MSGLKETFVKRSIVARTNVADRNETGRTVRKRRVVGRSYGMRDSLKGHKDRNRRKNMSENIDRNIPHHVKVDPWRRMHVACNR